MNFTSKSGYEIPSIFNSCHSSSCVLLLHGITSEKTESGLYQSLSDLLLNKGFDSLMFDFQGHGESSVESSNSTVHGMISELHDVYSILTSKYEYIHVVAASFGSSIFLNYCTRVQLDKLKSFTLWNPVVNYQKTFVKPSTEWGKNFYPQGNGQNVLDTKKHKVPGKTFYLGRDFIYELLFNNFDPTQLIITAQGLLLHGAQDNIVPIETVEEFYESIKDIIPIEMSVFPDASHGFDNFEDELFEKTLVNICNS